MAIQKRKLKTKDEYKVKFTLPAEISKEFNTASIVGDFNMWDPNKHVMKKNKKSGEFTITINLPAKNKFKFRYLLDGVQWINDDQADDFIQSHFGDAIDCVIILD